MNPGRRTIVADAAALAREGADRVAGACRWAIEERGRCSLALAGGTTPRAVYGRLTEARYDSLPWDRIEVYFGDERWVPGDHPDSNFRMAREALLEPRRLGPEQVFPMPTGGADRERAADEYASLLPERIDVILLGVGEDGHTASLFPGSDAAREEVRRVVAVCGPKPPPWRLTITPPVIRAGRRVIVFASGRGKADAVARALEGPFDPPAVPAQLAREGEWLLDEAAADRLRRRGDE